MFRVGFCVSGQGRLFRSAVIHRALLEIDPALLIADEKAAPALEDFCRQHGTKYVRLDGSDRASFDKELTRVCVEAGLDLIVLTFDKILCAELVENYQNRIINVHMSLLPSFKGFRAIGRALESGVKYVGASIHEVDNEVDAGPIVSQCLVSIGPEDTAETVGARLYSRLSLMYLQVIKWYAGGRAWRDSANRIWIRDADYSDEFTCPKIDAAFINALSGA